jgi:hypothetical protein
VSDQVLQWTHDPGSNLRSARVIANMCAVSLSAMLDEVLPKLVQYGKERSSHFLAVWKTAGGSRLPIRPSGKKASSWPKDLLGLFGLLLDPAVDEVLQDMISARNCAAHELPLIRDDIWGEHISAWSLATLWLAGTIAQELDGLITKK